MGHIAEPKYVDFIIESPPLSDKERKEISEFIEKLKKKKKRALNQQQDIKKKKADRTTATKKTRSGQ